MIEIPVSTGELLDKISILEIKARRIADPAKLGHVRRELALLRERSVAAGLEGRLDPLFDELRSVNEQLWEIEDRIRAHEAAGRFDHEFVELARAVYKTNDRRAAIKKAINERTGSAIQEVKSYQGS